ncbi:MAG: permease [Deltaproteobacteria bacterium]|nr:permease [Deltaproteobacteria bacterium]
MIFGWLLWLFGRRFSAVSSSIDGFVLTMVAGLCALHIIPHSMMAIGPSALFAAVVGFVVVWWTERQGSRRALGSFSGAAIPMALAGLAAHAIIDGGALASAGELGKGGLPLAAAVILHRVPIGAVLGRFTQRGLLWPGVALSVLVIATCLGYFAGGEILQAASPTAIHLLQGLVAGGLLHVVFHRAPHGQVRARSGAIGAALGAISLWFALDLHQHELPLSSIGLGATFARLALETAPALLLAFLGAGLLQAFVRPTGFAWIGRGGAAQQALRGMVFGLPLPICSCGVLPFYATLIRQHVPATAAISFLIATPEIGIDALFISWSLLGAPLTLVRIAAAALVAFLSALIVGRLAKPCQLPVDDRLQLAQSQNLSLSAKLQQAVWYGLGELVDHLLPWILVGLAIASFLEPSLREAALGAVPTILQVPLAALLGLPIYVCASGSTPLVAVLLHKGLSPGGAIAFLLTGPATNITTFGALSILHGRRTAITFAATVFALACALGWAIDAVTREFLPMALHEHRHGHHAWPIVEIAAASIMGLSALYSLWRCGPRGWIAQLSPLGADGHSHDHDHHDHDHHDHDHHDHDHHDHDR